jgi:hypothetical protein
MIMSVNASIGILIAIVFIIGLLAGIYLFCMVTALERKLRKPPQTPRVLRPSRGEEKRRYSYPERPPPSRADWWEGPDDQDPRSWPVERSDPR